MTWGIVVEWDDQGLECCSWLTHVPPLRRGLGYIDFNHFGPPMQSVIVFVTEADAADYIASESSAGPTDRILTAQEFMP